MCNIKNFSFSKNWVNFILSENQKSKNELCCRCCCCCYVLYSDMLMIFKSRNYTGKCIGIHWHLPTAGWIYKENFGECSRRFPSHIYKIKGDDREKDWNMALFSLLLVFVVWCVSSFLSVGKEWTRLNGFDGNWDYLSTRYIYIGLS